MRDRRSLLHLPFNILRTTLLLGSSGIAILLVVAFWSFFQFGWRWLQDMDGWLMVKNQEPEIDMPLLIVQQIRGVSELTTTIFAMETVVPVSQERQLGKFVLGRSSVLYIAYGEVRAGIDLSQIETQAVQESGDRLIVTLPAPVILDKKIDVERSQIYDYDRGFLNLGPDTTPELVTFAQRQTLDKLLLSACEQGILKRANDQADIAVTQLLNTAGYATIEVETTAPEMCGGETEKPVVPPSAAPTESDSPANQAPAVSE
ncbi:MAG: DUF4230 domain-containing protein [Limnothrix sp.]